ncbi:MAG: RimK family alpha-L-glutamate ligase [Lachnospiraceae bacterium]|nr:RimK family alpha-L-glutamate ligase [Lachnospiraceae bacterium]
MKALLVVNEFLFTNKYSELAAWILEAAKKRNVDMRLVTNAEVLAVMGEKQSVFSEDNKPDFVLFWDKDVRLCRYLEILGIPVFNSANAIEVCDDKSKTHLALYEAGIPMPETILAPMTYPNIGYGNYDFLTQVEERLGFPMVVKECFGSFGAQVYLVKDSEELLGKVKEIGTKPMLFQKFMKSSAGKDVRIQVVGNQVVTSMYRYSVNGDFRANITNGGHMKAYDPDEWEKDLAIRCVKAIGLDFAGVDLLFDENGKAIVCEVNSNAHFKNIFDCTGVNTAEHMIDYILDKVMTR